MPAAPELAWADLPAANDETAFVSNEPRPSTGNGLLILARLIAEDIRRRSTVPLDPVESPARPRKGKVVRCRVEAEPEMAPLDERS